MSETVRVDVLIIGSGPGGGSAAVQAARMGASTVVVEATGELGGNGAFSTGYVALADSQFQRDMGVQDDPEKFFSDMVREVERLPEAFHAKLDVELAKVYAEQSSAAYDFMIGLGMSFSRCIDRPRQHFTPRMLALGDPTQFRVAFTKAFEDLGIREYLRHSATDLITEGDRVTGAKVTDHAGDSFEVRAARGVVVCSGGFIANPAMRKKYQPTQDENAPFVGLHTADGSGILMMESLGAPLSNMELIPQFMRAPSRFIEDCIAINGEGQRFQDEAGPYQERVDGLMNEPGGIGYYLYDQSAAERHAQHIAQIPSKPKSFDSLEGVARAIGCESDRLVRTVHRWNDLLAGNEKKDPDFGRVVFPINRSPITTPPFWVVPMIVHPSMTNGGVRVTTRLEVRHRDGGVIPGLFAVGDCIGGVNAAVALGGIHLGSAVTLGMVAGRTVAG